MPYVSTRLGRWFYEEHGESRRPGDPAVVLCHGLLFDGAMWDAQIGALAAFGRVLVIDGPGHGKSEVPPPFSLDDHTRAFVDALDALDVFKTALVGLSWGGMVAMRMAIDHPMRVVAMALLDTSADRERTARRAKYRAFIAFCRRFGVPRALVEKEIAPLFFSPGSIEREPRLVDDLYHRVNGYPRVGVARAAKAVVVERVSILDKLRSVSCPTLVVCGKEDRATALEESQAICSRLPRATLTVLDGVGHMSAIERPEAVNELVVPFLREHLSAR